MKVPTQDCRNTASFSVYFFQKGLYTKTIGNLEKILFEDLDRRFPFITHLWIDRFAHMPKGAFLEVPYKRGCPYLHISFI